MQAEIHCRELLALAAQAGRTGGVDGLAEVAAAGRRFCAGLVGGETSGAWLARTLSELNDQVVKRVIQLTAAEHRLPSVPWCWLALGSEGRFEQTFITDQDNGLVFSAADQREADALRELFLPFAAAVNERLDRCGFAFCGGDVMARNPKWCLSLDEWRWRFSEWVRRPEPMALMHATIFFDFRTLWGEEQLGRTLRRYLLGLTRSTPAFLHLMAANALQSQPPLGFLGEVVGGEEGGGVDLKKSGARIFVDAARIFALAHGIEPVDTAGRLAGAGRAAGLQDDEVAAAIDAFSHLLRLRLHRQAEALAAGGLVDHQVDPGRLHELDRVILRECLRQAKRLQQRLKLNYAL
ncbi:MAG: nucleotidyltransferase [Rhodocyclaceae bacterium]|nr:nucleotidyltransferase [Rhodocyclaceae bacterium]